MYVCIQNGDTRRTNRSLGNSFHHFSIQSSPLAFRNHRGRACGRPHRTRTAAAVLRKGDKSGQTTACSTGDAQCAGNGLYKRVHSKHYAYRASKLYSLPAAQRAHEGGRVEEVQADIEGHHYDSTGGLAGDRT